MSKKKSIIITISAVMLSLVFIIIGYSIYNKIKNTDKYNINVEEYCPDKSSIHLEYTTYKNDEIFSFNDVHLDINDNNEYYIKNSQEIMRNDVGRKFIINSALKNFITYSSLNEDEAGIMMVANPVSRDGFTLQCFYMNNNEPKQIKFKAGENISDYIHTTTFFSQAYESESNDIVFINRDELNNIIKWSFDNSNGTFIKK